MSKPLGTEAPAFELPCVDGSLSGTACQPPSPMVVAFWCNHCPYVQAWEDRLNGVARDFLGRVRVVAVNANDPLRYPADDFPSMVRRARERRYAFDYVHDADQAVARAYGATRTPEVFVLDSHRVITYHGAIDDAVEPSQVTTHWLRDALTALLSGRPVDVPETPAVGCGIKWAETRPGIAGS